LFAGNFPPQDWSTCDGQLLSISQYEALFALIGTTYGGDGVETFALPNLAARTPIHQGNNGTSTYSMGEAGGVTNVTLSVAQIPAHSHQVAASSTGATTADPSNACFANANPQTLYTVPNSANNPGSPIFRNMNVNMLQSTGSNESHDNLQPYLALTYIISLFGIFPSQS
jgi:microcystin-dependent protein